MGDTLCVHVASIVHGLIFSLSIVDLETELVAPVIVIGPKDTTVVAGNEATLECIANAR